MELSFTCIASTPDYLVVAKEPGLPTVPLASRPAERSLLALVGARYPEILEPMGPLAHEGGVLHRLDTDTCGLVLIARTPYAFATLRKAQSAGLFIKRYAALVSDSPPPGGFPPFEASPSGIIESRFRPFGEGRKSVRPVSDTSPAHIREKGTKRSYRTEVRELQRPPEGRRVLLCTIDEGFRHQIRCHLAWSSRPIVGDRLYGGADSNRLHLAALRMDFPDPSSGKQVRVRWEAAPDWASPVFSPEFPL